MKFRCMCVVGEGFPVLTFDNAVPENGIERLIDVIEGTSVLNPNTSTPKFAGVNYYLTLMAVKRQPLVVHALDVQGYPHGARKISYDGAQLNISDFEVESADHLEAVVTQICPQMKGSVSDIRRFYTYSQGVNDYRDHFKQCFESTWFRLIPWFRQEIAAELSSFASATPAGNYSTKNAASPGLVDLGRMFAGDLEIQRQIGISPTDVDYVLLQHCRQNAATEENDVRRSLTMQYVLGNFLTTLVPTQWSTPSLDFYINDQARQHRVSIEEVRKFISGQCSLDELRERAASV